MTSLLLFLLAFLSLAFGTTLQPQVAPHRSHRKPDFYRGKAGVIHPTTEQRPKLSLPSRILASGSLVAVPAVVARSGDNVTVSWAGIENPTDEDWVAVYSPIDAPETEYLDYQWADVSPTYLQGQGSVTFSLLNIRQDYIFKYFQQDDSYVLAATSNSVSFANPNEPTQGHIALTSRSDQMSVTWVSNSSLIQPQVHYGFNSSVLSFISYGSTSTYNASMMCGPGANVSGAGSFIPPGQIHSVILTGLLPNTVYYYQFGNPSEGFSDIMSFTSPKPANPDTPVNFFAIGDIGLGPAPGAEQTIQRAFDLLPQTDLFMHYGDISYALGDAVIWDQYMSMIQSVATTIPYMISVGNHEYDHTSGGQNDPSRAPGDGFHPSWGNMGDDSNGECSVPTYYRFNMPDTGLSVYWYSFSYGSVTFIQLSMEHNFTQGSEQYVWLQWALSEVDRSITPWIVVGFHRPMYTSENYASDYEVSLHIQSSIEELLHEYEVDLVLAGHYHSYERTCPVYKQSCVQGGAVNVVLGMGGCALDDETYMKKPWSIYHDQVFGYTYVQVYNSTHLHFTYHHNVDNSIADEFWIVK